MADICADGSAQPASRLHNRAQGGYPQKSWRTSVSRADLSFMSIEWATARRNSRFFVVSSGHCGPDQCEWGLARSFLSLVIKILKQTKLSWKGNLVVFRSCVSLFLGFGCVSFFFFFMGYNAIYLLFRYIVWQLFLKSDILVHRWKDFTEG